MSMGYKTYTCPIARSCGGCEWLAVPYPVQLRRKQEWIERLFADLTKQDKTEISPIVGVRGEPLTYRHKAATPFAPAAKGRLRSGFYAAGTHRIVSCDTCLVEDPRARHILQEVARVATRLRIPAYNEDTGQGVLRHAIVRMGWKSKDVLLTIVTNGREVRRLSRFTDELKRMCPEVTSCVKTSTRATPTQCSAEKITCCGAVVLCMTSFLAAVLKLVLRAFTKPIRHKPRFYINWRLMRHSLRRGRRYSMHTAAQALLVFVRQLRHARIR